MEQKLDEFDAEVKRLRSLVIDAVANSSEGRGSGGGRVSRAVYSSGSGMSRDIPVLNIPGYPGISCLLFNVKQT